MFKVKWQDNLSTVLVSPLNPGNIGSAARAMKNMGFRRLKLVCPAGHLDEAARMLAVHANDVLESATVFGTLEEALGEEQLVVGTTSFRARRSRTRLFTAREIAPFVRSQLESQRVALVFGSERGGLAEPDLARCQYLVTIPTDEDCPTLNLAHAVLLMSYEIRLSELTGGTGEVQSLADHQALDQMYRHIEATLTRIGFLSQSNPGHIMRAVRRILGRSDLTPRDVQIIRGVMNQVDWFAREGHSLPAERVEKP